MSRSTTSSPRTPCSSRTRRRSPRTLPTAAQSLLEFLTTPETQAEYAHFGFRPVVDGVELPEVEGANDPSDPFPTIATLYTVDGDFGGWGEANGRFFDEEEGIITKLQEKTGTSE